MFAQLVADLPGALGIGGLFLALLVFTEIWTRLYQPEAELSRKIVHIVGGFLCTLFPFFISSPWTVLLLTTAMSVLFVFGSKLNFLHCLCRVERKSRGSEYYPLAIFLVFLLSHERIGVYLASILVLACADAGAALIGSRYGTIRYTVDRETKSLQGSFVFLLCAFVCVFFPLMLWSPLSLPVVVFSSLLVATVVTGIEAVSRHGRDNLFVPITVCLILPKITSKPLSEIIYQNCSLLGMLGLLSFTVWRSKSMNVGGCIATILFFYACWSLGSELWIVPSVGAFLLFLVSWQVTDLVDPDKDLLRVPVVARALTPPLTILLAANFLNRYDILFAPFVATIMQIASSFLWAHSSSRSAVPWHTILTFSLAPWAFIVLPSWYFQFGSGTELLWLLFLILLPFAYLAYQSPLATPDVSIYERNKYRTIKTYSIALLVYCLELSGVPPWIHW